MASSRKAPLADSDRNRQPPRQLPCYDPAPMKPVAYSPPDVHRNPFNPSIRLQLPISTNSTTTSPSLPSNTPSPTRTSSIVELAPYSYHSQPRRVATIPSIALPKKRLSSEAFPTELPPLADIRPAKENIYPARYGPEPRKPLPPLARPPPVERDSRNTLDFILQQPANADSKLPPVPTLPVPPAPPAPPPIPILRSQTITQPPPPISYPPPLPQSAPRTYVNQYEMHHAPALQLEPPLDPRAKRQKLNLEIPPEIDVHVVRLDGEPHGVAVFDTCDTVREKIRTLLRKDGITQAAFLRELGKVYDPPRKLQSKSLNDFLVKTGPRAGNTSCIYYSGYVFFEKKRVRDCEPRTKHRIKMEDIYAPKGCNTTEVRNRVYARVGERIWEDEFGRVHTS